MFDRHIHNRLQPDNDNQENAIKKQIVFFFYLFSLIIWSFILPTPIYFLLCGIAVIGTIALHVFPELDEKLGKAADWLSRKWSQLINKDVEPPAQELSASVDHSLIHRRLSQESIASNDTDNEMHYYDENAVQYGQLFAALQDVINLSRSSVSFNNVRRSNQRHC